MANPNEPKADSGRVEKPLTESHLMAQGRAIRLSLTLIAINIFGWLLLLKVAQCSPAHLKLAAAIAAFVTVLVGTPLISFLCLGWFTRYREFQNSLKGAALSAYLQRFWSQRLIQALIDAKVMPESRFENALSGDKWRDEADKNPLLCDRLFARIYHEQYGLPPFVPPLVILIAVAYAAAGLLGCNYNLDHCSLPTSSTCIYGLSQQMLLASFGGALMFVVSDSVLSIRRKSLNISDVYWYSLRIVLAVPIALAVGSTSGSDTARAATVFALGTFPVDALLKVIRRFGFPQLSDADRQGDSPDKLLSLNGVTLPVVATFEAEGINSVEQVATTDPVLLSIRTGFPFRFTLRLGSQAIVRRHFGEDASKLLPIGLADVVPIYLLMRAFDGITEERLPAGGAPKALPKVDNPDLIIENAAARLFPNDVEDQRTAIVKMKFRQIAAEEYTIMLKGITPLDPAL